MARRRTRTNLPWPLAIVGFVCIIMFWGLVFDLFGWIRRLLTNHP